MEAENFLRAELILKGSTGGIVYIICGEIHLKEAIELLRAYYAPDHSDVLDCCRKPIGRLVAVDGLLPGIKCFLRLLPFPSSTIRSLPQNLPAQILTRFSVSWTMKMLLPKV